MQYITDILTRVKHHINLLRSGGRYSRLLKQFFSNKLTVVGALMIFTIVFFAIFAPYVAPYPDARASVDFSQQYEPPSFEHPMGTDGEGRDILSRIIFGSSTALTIGLVVVSISIVIGGTVGLLAGYFGGTVQTVLMRTTDVFLAIPPILLALMFAAVVQPNLMNTMIAISLGWWTWYARLVQGEVILLKEEEFVEANEALGAKWYDTIFREILPNVYPPLLVKATLDMGFVILVAAGLSFIGFGAQPPTPSWGTMISQGRNVVVLYWWVSTMPGLAISWTVLGFNLVGDGLRDILDVEEVNS